MQVRSKLLKWWLIFCLTLIGFGIAHHFNMYELLYHADIRQTKSLPIGGMQAS